MVMAKDPLPMDSLWANGKPWQKTGQRTEHKVRVLTTSAPSLASPEAGLLLNQRLSVRRPAEHGRRLPRQYPTLCPSWGPGRSIGFAVLTTGHRHMPHDPLPSPHTMCYGLNCVPQKAVEALTFGVYESDLI